MSLRKFCLAALAALSLASCTGADRSTHVIANGSEGSGDEWTAPDGDNDETAFSRLSQIDAALDPKAFMQVVKGGSLLEKGMPRYDQLSQAQAIQIWHYVRQEARAVVKAKKPRG